MDELTENPKEGSNATEIHKNTIIKNIAGLYT